jgi:hypothetical protein
MNSLRRHLSYANVVATLALVFAMSGGALAASHYLITSTKQIKPSVLRKLKGNTGATGANGATGTTGIAGAAGPKGPQGSKGIQGEEGYEGEPGTARAYGEVTAAGALGIAGASKNIASVSSPSVGVYCIRATGLSGPVSTLVIATIRDGSNGAKVEVRGGEGTGGPCFGPVPRFEVDTFVSKANTTTGVISDEPTAEPFNFVIP